MNILKFTLLSLTIVACSIEYSLADGNKLLKSVKSGNIIKKYQYNSNGLLKTIRIERFGKLDSESKLFYKDGKVSEIIWHSPSQKEKVRRVFEYKGDLLIKETSYIKNEVSDISKYFYDNNNQLIKQIDSLQCNEKLNMRVHIIDIHKVAGKNELQIKYYGRHSFTITYDDKPSPYSYTKGYSAIYARQFYAITNNIITYAKIYPNGQKKGQKAKFTFDKSGKYPIKSIKKDDNQRLICEEIYTYE